VSQTFSWQILRVPGIPGVPQPNIDANNEPHRNVDNNHNIGNGANGAGAPIPMNAHPHND
jgi:hypothetical protein